MSVLTGIFLLNSYLKQAYNRKSQLTSWVQPANLGKSYNKTL